MDYGIKVSLPTKDTSSTNPIDYVVNSKYPHLKTIFSGTYNYVFNGATTGVTITITHNLGSTKLAWLSINGPTNTSKTTQWWFEYTNSGGNEYTRHWEIRSYSDRVEIQYGQTIYNGSFTPANGEAWELKYLIYLDAMI